MLTEENAAFDSPDAFYNGRVVRFKVLIARFGAVCAVHVVQVTTHVFVAVLQIHVLQQPGAQRAHAVYRKTKMNSFYNFSKIFFFCDFRSQENRYR